MGEYAFNFKTESRKEIIEKFNRVSSALDCNDDYKFTFKAKQAIQAAAFLSKLENPTDIEISAEGKIEITEQRDLAGYFKLLDIQDAELVNLTMYNNPDLNYDNPFGELTLVKRKNHIGISFRGSIPKPKNKTQEKEYFGYMINLFNDCFAVLGLDAKAEICISDGTKSSWRKGDKGITIHNAESDKNKDFQFTQSYLAQGCNRLDFTATNIEQSTEIMKRICLSIANTEAFREKRGSYTIWGKAGAVLPVMNQTGIPVTEIANKISREIDSSQSLLTAMETTPRFDGWIYIKRPYSFQNSLSDMLKLTLQDEKFFVSVQAGMTSETTVNKFRTMLSKQLGEEVELTKIYY
ncbi:hypothetical protein AAEO56_01145 [Flavobacterium sp. DGU11]|uniref:Uncharacterized protein n=1 Tax=Flavobacterium arundinis TaxID=3139143 RepID=A0ABU9HRQ9_9FLAO